MILNELLQNAPIDRRAFLDDFFFRVPFALAHSRTSWKELADCRLVTSIIDHPSVKVLVGPDARVWRETRKPNAAEAETLYANGSTIGLCHTERADPRIAELAARFELE